MNIDPKLSTKSKGLPLMVGMAILAMLAAALQASAQKTFTIDPPGAGTTAGLGTQSSAINESGVIVGFFSDSKFVSHSFLRTIDGTIRTFDAPGAGHQTVTTGFVPTPYGILWGQGTYAWSINREGTIGGFYVDGSNVAHGFLRSKNGEFTPFDAPNAASSAGAGTFATNINDDGTTAGPYVDASGVYHVFIRTRRGSIVQFDPPGTAFITGQGSFIGASSSLNLSGAIGGWYYDANGISHGYVRTRDGEFAMFEAPGSGTAAYQGTYAWTINSLGSVSGQWIDGSFVAHGFIRYRSGRITTFDYPGAGTAPGQGTVGEGIDATGAVVGYYIDKNGANHGFMRSFAGRFTTIDVSGAGTATGQGTIPMIDNSAGTTTGVYVDGNGVFHGFLRMSKCAH